MSKEQPPIDTFDQKTELKKHFIETLEKFDIEIPEQSREVFGVVVKKMIEDLQNKEISPEAAEKLLEVIRKFLINPSESKKVIDLEEVKRRRKEKENYDLFWGLRNRVTVDKYRELERFLKNSEKDPVVLEFYQMNSDNLTDKEIVDILADSTLEEWEWNPEMFEVLMESIKEKIKK